MNKLMKYLLGLVTVGITIDLYILNHERLISLHMFSSNETHVRNANNKTSPGHITSYSNDEMFATAPAPSLLNEFYFQGNHVVKLLLNHTSSSEMPRYKFTIIDWTSYHSSSDWTPKVIDNCLVTRDRRLASYSDVIAIVLRKLSSLSALPKGWRKPWQRWVWILDESPFHPLNSQPFRLGHLRDMFNWSMTYRSDSDVYIPYGYTFKLKEFQFIDENLFNKKRLLAAGVISNCGSGFNHNGRFTYIQELNKHMPVTLYGMCGIPCEGYSRSQISSHCPSVKNYKFFLAFENSNCKEYVTEKLFIHGLSIGVVPVVLGARKADYIKLAPPNSLIFADDFARPQDLAKYLVTLASNKTEYLKFHEWRRYFDVKYRLQYNDDLIWSPLCQKLNTLANSVEIQRAQSLRRFWDLHRNCDLSKDFL